MPNWKAPGPDFVQVFRLKNVKSIQEGLKTNLQKMLRKWKHANVDHKGVNNTNTERQRKRQCSK